MRLAGRSVIDDGLDVRLNQHVTGVEIALSRNVTTVSGSVTIANERSAADCQVIAFPQDAERWTFGSRYLSTARCDSKGRFVIQNLPPGKYLAAAVDTMEPGVHSDRRFLEWLANQSAPFTVSEAADASLHVALVHVP